MYQQKPDRLKAYARLMRLPGLGGLAIPPVIGALSVGVFDIRSLVILFVIGSFSAIYGFVLNDIADIELDRRVEALQQKPLVSGAISRRQAVYICVLSVFLAFFFIFYLWYGQALDQYKIWALACIILSKGLGNIYNLFGKRFVGADFLVAIAMACLVLFGALSFGPPGMFTWIIVMLTFNNSLHMNAVEGGIKDAGNDYIMGVKNIALSSGVRVNQNGVIIPASFKLFSIGIRLFSALLVFVPVLFFGYAYPLWQIMALAVILIGVLLLSVKLLSVKTFDRNKILRYIGAQAFIRYSLVPVFLVSIIGFHFTVFLIAFPLLWYVLFASLLGDQLFRPRM